MLKSFPAKVLLLGEYTILNGSKALALPYHELQGAWSYDRSPSEKRSASRKSLRDFIESLHSEALDLTQMKEDFIKGLWFDSIIPQGFGLGSSGALIAAIFQQYGKPSQNIQDDKRLLAELESFFHGSSSGLDPLVSHLQKPLLIHNFNQVEVLESRPNLRGFFLFDTGKPRQTGSLVSIFREKMKDPQFSQGCANILAREVDLAIDAVIKNERTQLFHHLWHISKFQWEFFPEMIPTKMRRLWTYGLESGEYIFKLCGAGGGGFILGFSNLHEPDEMRLILNTNELRELL